MSKTKKNKITTLSALENKSLYNIVRMVGMEELPSFANILNEKTILVLMERKRIDNFVKKNKLKE